MNKISSTIAGITLLLLGGMALLLNLSVSVFGIGHFFWAFGAMPIITLGLAFMLVPLLVRQSWAGVFFIPGAPILATGCIQLLQAFFHPSWGLLWPVEILAVALGFTLAAVYMRLIWLAIPAIILFVNGLALGFTNITGLWGAWSVLWVVEPLSIGLILMLISLRVRSTALFIIGAFVCAFAGMAATSLLVLFSGMWKVIGTLFGLGLLLAGMALIVWSFTRPAAQPSQTDEPAAA